MKRFSTFLLVILLAAVQAMAQSKPTLAVLGDSYSTYQGFIPKGYAVWYKQPANQKATDVTSVEQTWWWQVVKEGGYKLGAVNSYSGSTICNTGYNGNDYTDRSFVSRCTSLGTPDVILICGATNDSWAGVKMGDYKYSNWTKADLYFFRPAMAKMLFDISLHYPTADVYFILNTELKDEVNKSVEEVCAHYGVPVIKLHDIDKQSGHPNVKGMRSFADQVLKAIGKK